MIKVEPKRNLISRSGSESILKTESMSKLEEDRDIGDEFAETNVNTNNELSSGKHIPTETSDRRFSYGKSDLSGSDKDFKRHDS
jgi:hypothetical protein